MIAEAVSKFGAPLSYFPTKAPDRWKFLYGKLINQKMTFKPLSSVDSVTRRWVRNASDERAAQTLIDGRPVFRYSEKIGQSTVDWISTHCYLYEGPMAGRPMLVEDWQYEAIMQLFGWMWWHPFHKQWIRRFKEGSVWIPKKNAKSPTLAAIGLYTFCGEGEPGQKCYSVARDGEQAKIAHTHAIKMVEQSPVLSKECQIIRTNFDIRHLPTSSLYKIVNAKNSTSQEGLNGSIFVDETHVVGNDIMEIVRRAGISRLQPLLLEFSTVGDVSNDYGRSRFEYGLSVEKAESDLTFNPHFYFMNFSIDQKIPTSLLDSEAAILAVAKRTNPAIGRLFPPEEIIQDWKTSRRTPRSLNQFYRYRLGKWASMGSTWVGPDVWNKCTYKGKLTLDMLKGYPCAIGSDLSHVRDTTSITFLFGVPRVDEYGNKYINEIVPHAVTFFWLPESAIERYANRIDLTQFQGHIHFLKSEAIDQTVVADFVHQVMVDGHDIRGLGYDPYHSQLFIERLTKTHGWSDAIIRKVPSNHRFLSAPTKDLESLLVNETFVHEGNPVMSWQFGHCEVTYDNRGNYMPCKPNSQNAKGGGSDDCRKIDGVISLVNACAVSTDPDIGFRHLSGLEAV